MQRLFALPETHRVFPIGAVRNPGSLLKYLITSTGVCMLLPLLVGCGSGTLPLSPNIQPSVQRSISAQVVNPAATLTADDNIVINPSPDVPMKNRLFLFLGGSNSSPSQYQLIVQSGAMHGYHTIDLAYPNSPAVGQLCEDVPDAECTAKVREEIITGTDLSTLVDVNASNSIMGRLTDMLKYLQATYPSEGWAQFITNGQINWSIVTVAGHSQGAGHAAYLAKLVTLDRAVIFSGVADLSPDLTTAAWLSRPDVTPAEKQYAFINQLDPVVPYPIARNSWQALGLDAFGSPVSVDSVIPPYNGTHELTTDAALINYQPITVHSSPVADFATPLNKSGTPIFEPVWEYLAFP